MSASPTRMVTRADREAVKRKTKSPIIKVYAKKHGIPVIELKCPVVEIYREDYLGLIEVEGD